MNPQKKLYVGFNWIVYTLGSSCRPDEFPLTISGQKSVMDVTLKHPRAKANLSINSYVARMYEKDFPDMIKLVKKGVDSGQFEVTSMTHSEPIMSTLPYDEMVREVKWNLDTLGKVFGVRPRGAYNPEQSWDPFSGKIYLDAGVEWIAISNWQLYSTGYPRIEDNRDVFRPAYLKTVDGGRIKAVFNSLDVWQWGVPPDFRYGPNTFVQQYLHGHEDETITFPAFERLQKMNTDGDMLHLHCQDSENFWRAPYHGRKGYGKIRRHDGTFSGHSYPMKLTQHEMEERFDKLLTFLESLPYVEFVIISDYLQNVAPQKEYFVRSSAGHFYVDGLGMWERGLYDQASYNLNIQCNRAAEDIRNAELVTRLAKAKGKDTSYIEAIIKEAWENVGLARTASGRSSCGGQNKNEPLTMWCADHANKALQQAQEAIDEATKLLWQ